MVSHDVTSAHVEFAIKTTKESMTALGSNERGALKRVIRWRALASRENDNIDRFIKFWIALEALMNMDEEVTNIADGQKMLLCLKKRKSKKKLQNCQRERSENNKRFKAGNLSLWYLFIN